MRWRWRKCRPKRNKSATALPHTINPQEDENPKTLLRERPSWKDEHHKIIDSVAAEAVQAAREILQVVGEERMAELVTESIDIGRELVGDEAQRFYDERLDPQTVAGMKEVAKKFFLDPLGRERDSDDGAAQAS